MTDDEKLEILKGWSEMPVECLSGDSYDFWVKDEPTHSEKKWCRSFSNAADYAVGVGTGRRLATKGKVVISEERFKDLLRCENELLALEAGGVDNWEWYSDSLRDGGCFDEEDE